MWLQLCREQMVRAEQGSWKVSPPEYAGRREPESPLMDLNIEHAIRPEKVIANSLSFSGGIQHALDATAVSPLARDGQPKPSRRGMQFMRCALHEARRRKERTYPGLWSLVVLGIKQENDGVMKPPCFKSLSTPCKNGCKSRERT